MNTLQICIFLGLLGMAALLVIWALLTGGPVRDPGQHSQRNRDERTQPIWPSDWDGPAPRAPRPSTSQPLPAKEDMPWYTPDGRWHQ